MGIPAWHSSQNPVGPLLVYEVLSSTVETLESKVSNHLRRWLGLPKSLSSIVNNHNKLLLPFKSLEEKFKVTRAREVVKYGDSNNPKVAKTAPHNNTTRGKERCHLVQEKL